MTASRLVLLSCIVCSRFATPAIIHAQAVDHAAMHQMQSAPATTPPAQAAFATIADIVRKLKADSTTDWSRVNIEALRQHLIDMDDVVMRSAVKQSNIPGGVSLDVTGTGKVTGAIRRMVSMHAMALTSEGTYVAKSSDISGGVRLVVTAKDASNPKTVAMIRGLGFAGLLTEGDHHAMHHLMIAKGEPMMPGHKM